MTLFIISWLVSAIALVLFAIWYDRRYHDITIGNFLTYCAIGLFTGPIGLILCFSIWWEEEMKNRIGSWTIFDRTLIRKK